MPEIIRLYDRSRVTTDWFCPRKRYWNYEFEGKGIVNSRTSLELFLGTTVHDALALIATQHLAGGVDIDEIANLSFQQTVENLMPNLDGADREVFANEQGTLVEGLVRGFYKQVWPGLMLSYPTILAIEQEMEYRHDGLLFMSKPDLVVANDADDLVYIEYKTTSNKKEEWINSWDTAIQLHSTIRAIESTLGVLPREVIVQGLWKGYVSYGKQSSPMCYCYRKLGNPPFSSDQLSYEYKPGLKKYPVWELPGGVAEWVDQMPGGMLQEQFPQSPPIFVNEDMVNQFFIQRGIRENEISEFHVSGGDYTLDEVFPQRFDQCQPGWGKPCTYRQLCHGSSENPLLSGFSYRTPHHQQELDQQLAQEKLDAE